MKISIASIYNWYRNAIRHPKYRWWVMIGTLVYLISPIDIAPDFIPIVGELDDLMLVTLLVKEVSDLILDKFKSRQAQKDVASTNSASQETVDVRAESVTVNQS
jgi:uncharacterized membrane protein YkvA (DUF1232 family)